MYGPATSRNPAPRNAGERHQRGQLIRVAGRTGRSRRVDTTAAGSKIPSGRVRYARALKPIASGNQANRPSRRNRTAAQRPKVHQSRNVLSESTLTTT